MPLLGLLLSLATLQQASTTVLPPAPLVEQSIPEYVSVPLQVSGEQQHDPGTFVPRKLELTMARLALRLSPPQGLPEMVTVQMDYAGPINVQESPVP